MKALRFLDLPAEIRNRIYEHALPQDAMLLLPGACTHQSVTSAVQPALTRVCRQVRAEALPVFYAENCFVAHVHRFDVGHFIHFMTAIGQEKRSMIRKVILYLASQENAGCGQGLLQYVRWVTSERGIEKLSIKIDGDIDSDAEYIMDDATTLAWKLVAERRTSEAKVRQALKEFLVREEFECHSGIHPNASGWCSQQQEDVEDCYASIGVVPLERTSQENLMGLALAEGRVA